jgi:polyisoprenoid-binding protein YceI
MPTATHPSLRRALLLAFAAALLAACVPPPARVPATAVPPPAAFPDAYYRQAAAAGRVVFVLDPARSLVLLEVRRAGTLAQLGHDHVLASRDVRGYVAPEAGRADLYVPLDGLTVDEAPLRAQAGFDTQPDAAAIAGTRENMLYKLRADEFPHALIAVRAPASAGAPYEVALTLAGTTQTLPVVARIEAAGGEWRATGRFSVAQTAFGIRPFSILGGALTVRDDVDIRFDLRARRFAD